ncbi:LEA domain containing protein [Metarhizium album ARSEF 1941]|uniref:LEA domain containing protein n=1 Tax=Metarhizium album (strain ARSEF 1941) TaxID=1081103 RepID=A0A0B2WQS8_METAS|nr:LEA domain containing protein [Metarhizium album ARSEF 1941]KHN98416.1 LEA domain containing protein [Metarhizium album ARSEF 1941]
MPVKNPLSSLNPVGSGTEQDNKQNQGTDTTESVPRTVAGVVNEKGEIVDKSGKVIGTVTDLKDYEKLVGGAVTEQGDVVSDKGDSLANVHIDDNYTPTRAPEKKEGGGWNVLGKAKTAMQYGDSIRSAVSYGQNLQGAYSKFAGGQKAEAEKAGERAGEEAGGQKAEAEKAGERSGQEAGEDVQGAGESAGGEDQIPTPVKMEDKDSPAQQDVGAETEGLKSQADETQGAAEKSATEAKDKTESALGETENDVQGRGDSLAAQSPRPISEEDIKDKDIPESLKESTEATPAGENAPEEGLEGATGDHKIDEEKAASLKPEEGQPSEDKSDKDNLEDMKPGESTLGEAKDEATGTAEGGELSEDKLGQDKVDETKPDEGALDETSGKVEQDQRSEDNLDQEKSDETKADKEALDETADKAEEGAEEAGETAEKALDFSVLKGTKVNKAGNLVNEHGDIIGRLVDGDAKKLIGKTADEKGQIWNESGQIIGKAEPIPDLEREAAAKDFAPFENFPDAIVEGDGRVMSEGRQVGEVVEGDVKRMKGSRVDEDGDILDRRGNVIGKAVPWDEPEPIPEQAPDMSSLAGKRVNKAGNVVDAHGQIFGRVVEGNVKALVGRMCDREGNIMSESGEKIGRAELVSESEREGSRDGPFADLPGCTVTRDGKVVTSSGDVVDRLTSGDGKALYGRPVDEDGDVLDKNGNVLGRAERWEEPEVEKKKDPLAGRRVNREGNVVDEDGNIIGRLVSGDLSVCAGKEIDDDGDVVNSKGIAVGHVSLLADIPTEPAEEKEKREQAERDRKLAGQLAASIEQSLDKIKPILRMITAKVDTAERTPKEELDEEQLVREVRPLIEEGSKILTETNGVVRGMDPDGRIQRQAKHKASTKDATPEEHHLAEVLKELTGDVTQTIDNAKRKIEGMPHAKKELNPLWGLLSEPLFQIVAAVGLLLNGVLSLVGRLLGGLGLGGLVDNLLGTLGLNRVLDGLGLGSVTSALTGKKEKKK